jgi:hypothetical protein
LREECLVAADKTVFRHKNLATPTPPGARGPSRRPASPDLESITQRAIFDGASNAAFGFGLRFPAIIINCQQGYFQRDESASTATIKFQNIFIFQL